MAAVIYNIREFQTVRDNVRAAGLNPSALYAQLRAEQRSGNRGSATVAKAQNLRRQFRDELSPGAA